MKIRAHQFSFTDIYPKYPQSPLRADTADTTCAFVGEAGEVVIRDNYSCLRAAHLAREAIKHWAEGHRSLETLQPILPEAVAIAILYGKVAEQANTIQRLENLLKG